MKNICIVPPTYVHQGTQLSSKLVYEVMDEVADGMAGLGLAQIVADPADLTLVGLTWESGTVLAQQVAPAPIVQRQAA